MTFPRRIRLAEVLAMLDTCAPAHTRRETRHSIQVYLGKLTFNLPSGDHASLSKAEIGTSQVRSMVRQLGIPKDCAGRELPTLAGSF